MEREKAFLENLEPNEIVYLFQKEKEDEIEKRRKDFNDMFSKQNILERHENAARSLSPTKQAAEPESEKQGGSVMERTFNLRNK